MVSPMESALAVRKIGPSNSYGDAGDCASAPRGRGNGGVDRAVSGCASLSFPSFSQGRSIIGNATDFGSVESQFESERPRHVPG